MMNASTRPSLISGGILTALWPHRGVWGDRLYRGSAPEVSFSGDVKVERVWGAGAGARKGIPGRREGAIEFEMRNAHSLGINPGNTRYITARSL